MNQLKSLKIALVGNPNCGKTTLFNILTQGQQKVGNWPGVTVEKKTGSYLEENTRIQVTDLPGIYSLNLSNQDHSLDETIAYQFLLKQSVQLIINIVDASNLKRHLYLTRQLLELQIPCIIVLNMTDIAQTRNIQIDAKSLSQSLGCPVVPMVCNKLQGIKTLKSEILKFTELSTTAFVKPIAWPEPIATAQRELVQTLIDHKCNQKRLNLNYDWLAIRLLEKDRLSESLDISELAKDKTDHLISSLENHYQEETDILLADFRYQWVEKIVSACSLKKGPSKPYLGEKIDKFVMHPFLGIPIFLLIMYLMFEFSMSIGTLLQPLFDLSTSTLFVDGFNYLGYELHLPSFLIAILANGIGLGINTVASFIPQIGLLFLALSFLEDCGYMARAAFVMDRLMQSVGLPGKSFIPLIIGFGCNVPAIMATRTLNSQRDRILTAMMAPFMSCGARLAIFVVFGSTFFPHHAGSMIFLLYLIGIIIALITGLILKYTVLRGDPAPFILEMPAYHTPILKNLLILAWQRLKAFIVRAGRIIIPICVLVGSLNTIQIDGTINPNGGANSLLSVAGKKVTPLFSPMGIQQENWPATVGLLTGVLAKEVVVGTLNTLYTKNQITENNSHHFDLWKGLSDSLKVTLQGFKQIFSLQMLNPFTVTIADHDMTRSAVGNMSLAFGSSWAAFSYLLFVLLYVPCVSTMGTIAREVGSKWAWLSTGWSILIAYTLAVICFQLSQITLFPLTTLAWVISLGLIQLLFLGILSKKGKTQHQLEQKINPLMKVYNTK